MHLPRVGRKAYGDAERQRLWRWLLAWEIDRKARDGLPRTGVLPPRDPEAVAPAAGQVRLLHPRSDITTCAPVYCAILVAGPDGPLLAAPFSRYQDPALPGELLVPGMPPGLCVLAVWNAALVHDDRLTSSWLAGKLKQRDLRRALRIHAALERDGRIPDRLRSLVGPEIHHPQDPRVEYRRQARADWVGALEECASDQSPRYETPTTLPKAAEPRKPYTVRPPKDAG